MQVKLILQRSVGTTDTALWYRPSREGCVTLHPVGLQLPLRFTGPSAEENTAGGAGKALCVTFHRTVLGEVGVRYLVCEPALIIFDGRAWHQGCLYGDGSA